MPQPGIEPLVELGLIERARRFGGSVAVRQDGTEHRYDQLLADSEALALVLLDGAADLGGARVGCFCAPGYDYVVALWAIWRAGGIAVPLAVSHPLAELQRALERTTCSVVVADDALRLRLAGEAEGQGLRIVDGHARGAITEHSVPSVDLERPAIIFFTSGTSGQPKGVVWTHAMLQAQVAMMESAWGWTAADVALSVLPLHHVHGAVNVVETALWSGATCEFVSQATPEVIWAAMEAGRVSVFMAVPTVYVKLIRAWEEASPALQAVRSRGARRLRLMVSGSAALPVQVLDRWRAITGHVLLERYGMTEIGMAVSNPLQGPRIRGAVGTPLPGVEVRLVDETGHDVAADAPGEILVRGRGVFRDYWNAPEATREAFVDGWFRTGDVAVWQDGTLRILGRNSTDIVKTGGYKVSALEIEETLREHPAVEDCAVIGLADEEWGERVGAVVVVRPGASVDGLELRRWMGERLAPYKVPSRVAFVSDLPRTAVGKVVKTDLAGLAEWQSAGAPRPDS